MKIEAGKFYRTRDGRKVGPMEVSRDATYPWKARANDGWRSFTGSGLFLLHAYPSALDLIAEWVDPAPEPAKAGLPDVMGFLDEYSAKIMVEAEGAFVSVATSSTAHDETVSLCFTPERARALAAALTAYADQAEAAQ
jgi:hypothetical protein